MEDSSKVNSFQLRRLWGVVSPVLAAVFGIGFAIHLGRYLVAVFSGYKLIALNVRGSKTSDTLKLKGYAGGRKISCPDGVLK